MATTTEVPNEVGRKLDWLTGIEPPEGSVTVKADGWWGSSLWLIRGERPKGLPPVTTSEKGTAKAGKLIAHISNRLGGLVPADLRPARYQRTGEAVIPVGADLCFAVDPRILLCVEAWAEVETWGWTKVDLPGGIEGVLTGLREGIHVATISPIRHSGWKSEESQ